MQAKNTVGIIGTWREADKILAKTKNDADTQLLTKLSNPIGKPFAV